MDSESLSFQEDGDRSGDIIMSENDIDPNYEPSEEGTFISHCNTLTNSQ